MAILPWNKEAAESYAEMRTSCEAAGVTPASMDMMIAAHAKALDQVSGTSNAATSLGTHDRAFSRIPGGIKLEDWTVTA